MPRFEIQFQIVSGQLTTQERQRVRQAAIDALGTKPRNWEPSPPRQIELRGVTYDFFEASLTTEADALEFFAAVTAELEAAGVTAPSYMWLKVVAANGDVTSTWRWP